MTAILQVTDGTNTVDLLNPTGLHLEKWEQNVLGYKSDGVWQDSPMANGRQLAMTVYANIIDEFVIKGKGGTQDTAIRNLQDLIRLLQKGKDYWTSNWQTTPIYLKAKATSESHVRYAIVKSFRIDSLNSPYAGPFLQTDCTALFDGISVFVEHGPWQEQPVGTGTRVEVCTENYAETAGWLVSTSDPTNVNYGMIETQTGRMIVADTADMYYTDDGSAWSAAASAPASGAAISGLCRFSYTGYLYASGVISFTGAPEVWRSIDNGTNWSQLAATVGNNGSSNSVRNAIIDGNDNYLYMVDMNGTCSYGLGCCLYSVISRSQDGSTWTVVSTPDIPATMNCKAIAYYRHAMYFQMPGRNPVNPPMGLTVRPALVVATCAMPYGTGCVGDGNIEFYLSWNGTDWYPPAYLAKLGIIDAYGASHTFNSGVDGFPSYLYENPTDNYLYMGTTDGKIFRSTSGFGWTEIQQLVDGITVNAIVAHGSSLVVGLDNGNVWIGDGTSFALSADLGTGIGGICSYSTNGYLYASELGGDAVYYLSQEATGQACTSEDAVIVANKQNTAPVTHAYSYDAGTTTYTSIYPAGTFPVQILPAAVANNDIAYFGNNTGASGIGTGPFSNLVFDIEATIVGGSFTLTWQYWNGGWVALDCVDETDGLTIGGVGVVSWVPPADWATTAVNGVTGYWVRGIVSATSGTPVGPAQDNRDIYTVTWANITIEKEQAPGDIPALIRIASRNRSSDGAYESYAPAPGEDLTTLANRFIVGLRSVDRGSQFCAYINCADEQNPFGITVAAGTDTSFVDAMSRTATARMARHDTSSVAAGLNIYDDVLTITFGPGTARDFYGEYHAFLRGHAQYNDVPASVTDVPENVRLRLKVQSGSGGIQYIGDYTMFTCFDEDTYYYADHQLLDMGRISLPVSGLFLSSELSDEMSITVQIASATTMDAYIYLEDLILIPVDEWSGNFEDTTLNEYSGVYHNAVIDIDSVSHPRHTIRALAKDGGTSGFVRSVYQCITAGPAILQANADQTLWFLNARGIIIGMHVGNDNNAYLRGDTTASFVRAGVKPGMTVYNVTDGSSATITNVEGWFVYGTLAGGADNDWDVGDVYYIICGNWRSEPWNVTSLQLERISRYTAMRGDR